MAREGKEGEKQRRRDELLPLADDDGGVLDGYRTKVREEFRDHSADLSVRQSFLSKEDNRVAERITRFLEQKRKK